MSYKKNLCVYVSYKKYLCVYMSYKKKLCVYMSFNIKRHIYTSVISWCFSGTSTETSSWSIFSAHVTDTFWLCNDFANLDQKSLFAAFQSHSSQMISSIKSVNELQWHSINVRANCASIIFLRHLHAASISQRAAARPAWILLTAGGTHGHPLQSGRCVQSHEVCGWPYVPCVFIRLYREFFADPSGQLTLRPFDEGCREPDGDDSFLCEEFGKKFWRQQVAFD